MASDPFGPTRKEVGPGFKVMPHTHPNTENVTVISGQSHIGTGDKFDESKLEALKAGGYVQVPHGMPHYAMTSEETVIQQHGIGPLLHDRSA